MRARALAGLPAASDGFTIIEVLVAALLLVVGALSVLAILDTANATSATNQGRAGAVNLVRQVLENARAATATVPYAQLTQGCPAPSSLANPCSSSSSLVQALQAEPGLAPDASSPPGTWRVTRRGTPFQVVVAVCSMDDPSDGTGNHSQGDFCADSPAAGTADSNADDYKRVTVDVSWPIRTGRQHVREVTLIDTDTVTGPGVTCLRLSTDPSCPDSPAPVTSTTATSLAFTVTTSAQAAKIVWYVDGAAEGQITPTSTTTSFSWPIPAAGSAGGLYDGTYTISAIGFDANGASGAVGVLQVQLNRGLASAPTGFYGGRDSALAANPAGVDLTWLPSPDHDVIYYRVYRQDTSSGTTTRVFQSADARTLDYSDLTAPALGVSIPNNCGSPPGTLGTSHLYYWVVAVDTDPTTGAPREGTPTASIDANLCNNAPKMPGWLTIVRNADGSLTLNWSSPNGQPDPDSNDTVGGYRIYRFAPGQASANDPGDRLAYVPDLSTTSWTDTSPDPGGVAQQYCVTSVDTHMQESACGNVVTQ